MTNSILDQIKKSAEVRRDELANGHSDFRAGWNARNTEIELLAKALEVAIEEIKKICECKTGWSGSDNEYESDFCQSCIAITKITELLKPLLGQDGSGE